MSAITSLQRLLCSTHSLSWTSWVFHWQASGPSYYSDHLLYMRVYEETHALIDGLAEKIVGTFGGHPINSQLTLGVSAKMSPDDSKPSPIVLLDMVEAQIERIGEARQALLEEDRLSSGLDNYLQGMEDAHETHLYLLKQRVSGT